MYPVFATPICHYAAMQSLVERHLIDRPAPVRSTAELIKIKLACGLTPYTKIINGYRGAKKRMYEGAYFELQRDGLTQQDYKVRSFVKVEKWDTLNKAPRMIQARSPKYVLSLAHYLKDFEHHFYQKKHNGMRFVTKGLNRRQIADLYVESLSDFTDPICLELDHSKFDSSVSEQLLRWEHKQYLRNIPSRALKYLLQRQVKNICSVQRTDIKYTVTGTRMSGDFNTALGNTLINYALLERFTRGVYTRLLVDGDDSVVIVERRDLSKLVGNFGVFLDFGFNTKCKISEWDKVEYCQARLVEVKGGYMFLRNPAKILSNLNVNLVDYHDKAINRYVAGVALGELHQVRGVPYLTRVLEPLTKLVPRNSVILDQKTRYVLSLDPVDVECDDSVMDVWNFDYTITPTVYPRSKARVLYDTLVLDYIG